MEYILKSNEISNCKTVNNGTPACWCLSVTPPPNMQNESQYFSILSILIFSLNNLTLKVNSHLHEQSKLYRLRKADIVQSKT